MPPTLQELAERAKNSSPPTRGFETFAHVRIATGEITWIGDEDTTEETAYELRRYAHQPERVIRVRVEPVTP